MKKTLSYFLLTFLFLFLCGCTTPALQQNEQPVSGGKVTEAVEGNDETKVPEEGTLPEQSGGPAEDVPESPEQVTQPAPTAKPVHTHSFVEEVTTEADCVAEGVLTRTCSECGAVETEAIPLTEHTWNEGEVTTEATCGAEGVKTLSCAVCSEIKEEVLSATGAHTWDDGVVITEPTCVAEGVKTVSCTVCEATEEKVVPVSEEHAWNAGEVTKAATCAGKGEILLSCTLCEATKTEALAPTDSHVWDKGKVTKKPTCGAKGTKTFTCTVCDKTKTQSVDATGEHSWNKGKVTKEPTCYRKGVRTFTCTACKATKTADIATTEEHSWNRGTVTKEPTKTTEGICTYTCYDCKKTKEEKTGTYYFDAADYGDPYHIRTTNNPDCYLDFSISGSTLTVSGKIVQEGLEKVWIRCGGEGTPFRASAGQFFSTSFSLSGISENTAQLVTVYTKKVTDTTFWGYSWKDINVTKQSGAYCFVPSMVLDHNLEVMSHWVNPKSGLSASISSEVVELSNRIVGNETDEYKKLYLLNYWVADNIYYDNDYLYNRDNKVYYDAKDVAEQKRSVCAGYADLLQELVQAQGIPCIQVSTYSAGVGTKGYFDSSNYSTTNSNHAHVEAFVDGRWVAMDATWDSKNKYENGQFIYKAPLIRYFDANLDFFSFSHKLIGR